MNTENDPLEAELAALRPCEPSPKLHERIAERLAADSAPPHPRPLPHNGRGVRRGWRWIAGLAAGVIAAGIAVAVLLPRGSDRPPVAEPPVEAPQPLVASAFDKALPTLWQYHSTLGRSPNELDALLDQHAGPGSAVGSASTPIHAFTRFNPGEL